MKPCDKHPDREGTLAIDLPSLGIKGYRCAECRASETQAFTAFKGKREAWEQRSDWVVGPGGMIGYSDARGVTDYPWHGEEL